MSSHNQNIKNDKNNDYVDQYDETNLESLNLDNNEVQFIGTIGHYQVIGETTIVGMTGPRGLPGPQGIPGHDGLRGPTGPLGPIGPRGFPGANGNAGPRGVTGPTGFGQRGPAGLIGPIGHAGVTGPKGQMGPQGPRGLRGGEGAAGPRGEVGPSGGPIGPTGDIGPTGQLGPPGFDGNTGPVGPTGNIGPTGTQGPIGPAGSRGIMGPTGLQGTIGPTGSVGAGATGPTGPVSLQPSYANVYRKTTQTLAFGSTIAFVNGIMSSDISLDSNAIIFQNSGIYSITYGITFQTTATVGSIESHAIALAQNGSVVVTSTFGASTIVGQTVSECQINGNCILSITASDTLMLQNYGVTPITLAATSDTQIILSAYVSVIKVN
jgi:hypothetical protein